MAEFVIEIVDGPRGGLRRLAELIEPGLEPLPRKITVGSRRGRSRHLWARLLAREGSPVGATAALERASAKSRFPHTHPFFIETVSCSMRRGSAVPAREGSGRRIDEWLSELAQWGFGGNGWKGMEYEGS